MQALAELVRPMAEKFQLSTLPLHIQHICAAYLLYEFIFRVISPYGSQFLFPGAYGRLDRRGKVNWDAHVVSMIQCLIINSMALDVMFNDPERLLAEKSWRERLWGYSVRTGTTQGFAAGYFLWDTLVSMEHIDVLGASGLLHGIAALSVTMLGFRPFANYYGINFVLYELSTPFLNIHWFLDKFGLTGSTAQLINGILLIGSFFGARLVWGVYQSYLIYNDVWMAWHMQSTDALASTCAKIFKSTRLGTVIDTPLKCRVLPTWLGVLYIGANTALTLLNVYWFSKMVVAVRKRFVPKTAGPPESKKEK
jgi:hypothetical protein